MSRPDLQLTTVQTKQVATRAVGFLHPGLQHLQRRHVLVELVHQDLAFTSPAAHDGSHLGWAGPVDQSVDKRLGLITRLQSSRLLVGGMDVTLLNQVGVFAVIVRMEVVSETSEFKPARITTNHPHGLPPWDKE